jgi:hypothetical protein
MSKRHPSGFISAFYDPLKNPNAPTIGTATGGDTSASVPFTAPSNVGGSAISEYYAISDPSRITASAASSPINVTGLTNGTPYTFAVWAINTYGPSAYSASTGSVTPVANPNMGVFAGGSNGGTQYNVIDYVTITSTGNATDFGDLQAVNSLFGACSSTTRGVFGGGNSATYTSAIEYITFATTGNATSFGSLTQVKNQLSACSSSTRGVFGGGNNSGTVVNVLEYITIASTGNGTDFGDMTYTSVNCDACASPTRGIFAAGYSPAVGNATSAINYITIATTGNATSFGSLSVTYDNRGACSSSTRGLFAGGSLLFPSSGLVQRIDYITIATTGNSTNFGDLTVGRASLAACSSETRGVFAGGDNSGPQNVIDYVTIASTGNATDFGDLTLARFSFAGCSSAHGGLQ